MLCKKEFFFRIITIIKFQSVAKEKCIDFFFSSVALVLKTSKITAYYDVIDRKRLL